MSVRDELDTWDPATVAIGVVAGILLALGASLTLGLHLWALFAGVTLPANPFTLLLEVAHGTVHLTAAVWACTALTLLLIALVVLMGRRMVMGPGGDKTRADKAARRTGLPRDTKPLSPKAVAAKAKRLGAAPGVTGLPVGRAVAGGRSFMSSVEEVCVLIAGPRTGKTTSWVIPRIYAAPGAVVATSNKRDIVDETRKRRGDFGRVWVFDPQGIAEEPQRWWWNILSYVTDAVQARALTQVFVDATRDPSAQTSAYFDSAAQDLVAAMLLAAARSGRDITALHGWLNDQNDDEPVTLLRAAGEHMMADTLQGTINLVPETRSGVYGSAATIMSFMLNEAAMAWVTPSPWLEEFRPEDFVASTDTLYCLSQEGRGSASPIVTALTVAVTEAAVDYAKTQPGGRLALPMLIELDEAANVCRWRELPDMYSHFGSRGILVDTILQSWSQGAKAWTDKGMDALWSAANIKMYAGGVSEKSFLSVLSELIGTYYEDSRQTSHSRQGHSSSISQQSQQRPIATVADLQALPARRAWVFASGATPVLTRLVPYWQTKPATPKTSERSTK